MPQPPQKPLLHILIPTYNRLVELERLLESLVDQGYGDFSGEVKILVSENGGSEGADQVVKPYLEKLPLTYVKQPAPFGALIHIAYLYGLSEGEYLWVIGDDDFITDMKWPELRIKLSQKNLDVLLLENYYEHRNGTIIQDLASEKLNHEPLGPRDALEMAVLHPSVFTFISVVLMRTSRVHRVLSQANAGNGFFPAEVLFLVSHGGIAEYLPGTRVRGSLVKSSWLDLSSQYICFDFPIMLDRLHNILPSKQIDVAIASIVQSGWLNISNIINHNKDMAVYFTSRHRQAVKRGLALGGMRSINKQFFRHFRRGLLARLSSFFGKRTKKNTSVL